MNSELPQTLPGFDPTCYFDKENSVPCISKPNFVDESSNIFNPPPQPPIYSCEFCKSNAQYGHYCTPQVPFINPEPELFRKLSNDLQNIHEELAEYINTPGWNRHAFYNDDDDDDDVEYTIAITPVLSTEEPDNSLSMGDEHLDTIPATKSDEVIKSSVENLVPIPSESEGIPDTMCDVHLVNNPTPLEAKDHFESVIKSKDDISSSDDDSLYNENIEYVEASPHNFKVVSLEVAEIVIPEDEIEDDNLREKLLNVNLLIAKIEALKDNPTPSSELLTKSDFAYEEFSGKLAHIIAPPEYDRFYFWNLPDPGELISILNFEIHENPSTTHVNLPVEDDYSSLLAYVVWIFLAYLTIPGNVKTLAKGFYPPSLHFLSFNWES
nr:hypothetical protein [Tanacetum cinerariifolium]